MLFRSDLTKSLRGGKNVLAVQANNLPAPVKLNPASVMMVLELVSEGGSMLIGSDAQWRVAQKESPGWQEVGFDDASWSEAKVVAKYGEGPWGKVGENNSSFLPYAMGVGKELRIAYAISARPLIVTQLQPDTRYELTEFDPVTGDTQKETVRTDESGQLRRAAPTHGHDWVIALKSKN